MDLSFFQSQTAQQLRAEGYANGLAEKSLLALLSYRGIPASDEDRKRIASCWDLDTLHVWTTRAITATSAAEVFEGEPA
ncbi:hypothetical protein ABZ759_18435 [Streptomyces sp. NPDC047860]|uniref:hypothetical protein n=1 Tax=Streptomyces sp. NPDC047860 TaxID=3155743 RepID=UPI0033CAFCBC